MSGTHGSFQATPTTVGRLLAGDPLAVPRFQREYAWTEDEVDKLLRDFSRAKRSSPDSYFLGSIVLSSGGAMLEVIDGQQRLATSAILLSVVRDLLLDLDREPQAESIEQQFLRRRDFDEGTIASRLTLNVDDRAFFWQAIVCRPGSPERVGAADRFDSHRNILAAQTIIRDWIADEVDKATDASDRIEVLSRWRTFINDNAVVAALIARDRRQAFRMFVTLNDRGLQVSQTDLVKNHLFEKAQNQFESVQSAWTQSRTTLEALDLERVALDYLRHFLAMRKGLVREEEIFDVVDNDVVDERSAVLFCEQLAERANDYASVLLASHPRWRSTQNGPVIKDRLTVLNDELQVKFPRALLLAIASYFPEREIAGAMKVITSMAVRLLVVGGSRSGRTEEAIAGAAKRVAAKEIATAADLANLLAATTPVDIVFKEAFSEKRFDKSRVARYLIRSVESYWRQDTHPETTIVSDASQVTLEHLLPKKYLPGTTGWTHFDEDEHRAYATRLGNLLLVRSGDNQIMDRSPFAEKRVILEQVDGVFTTEDVIENTTPESLWTKENIEARQSRFSDAAIAIWPMTP